MMRNSTTRTINIEIAEDDDEGVDMMSCVKGDCDDGGVQENMLPIPSSKSQQSKK